MSFRTEDLSLFWKIAPQRKDIAQQIFACPPQSSVAATCLQRSVNKLIKKSARLQSDSCVIGYSCSKLS